MFETDSDRILVSVWNLHQALGTDDYDLGFGHDSGYALDHGEEVRLTPIPSQKLWRAEVYLEDDGVTVPIARRMEPHEILTLCESLDDMVRLFDEVDGSLETFDKDDFFHLGGHKPDDTTNVYAWDEERVLLVDGEAMLLDRWEHEHPDAAHMKDNERVGLIRALRAQGRKALADQIRGLIKKDDLRNSLYLSRPGGPLMTGSEAKAVLKASGVSRRAVAVELDIDESTIGRWFRSKELSRRDQYALERALDKIRARKFYGDTEQDDISTAIDFLFHPERTLRDAIEFGRFPADALSAAAKDPNNPRKQEDADRFCAALKELEEGNPRTVDLIDGN